MCSARARRRRATASTHARAQQSFASLGVVHGEKPRVVTLFGVRGDETQSTGTNRRAEISKRGAQFFSRNGGGSVRPVHDVVSERLARERSPRSPSHRRRSPRALPSSPPPRLAGAQTTSASLDATSRRETARVEDADAARATPRRTRRVNLRSRTDVSCGGIKQRRPRARHRVVSHASTERGGEARAPRLKSAPRARRAGSVARRRVRTLDASSKHVDASSSSSPSSSPKSSSSSPRAWDASFARVPFVTPRTSSTNRATRRRTSRPTASPRNTRARVEAVQTSACPSHSRSSPR